MALNIQHIQRVSIKKSPQESFALKAPALTGGDTGKIQGRLPQYKGMPLNLQAIEQEVELLTDADLAKRGEAWSPAFYKVNNKKDLAVSIINFFDTGSPVYAEECRGTCKGERGPKDGLIDKTELSKTIGGKVYTLFSTPPSSSGAVEPLNKACP